MLGYASPADLAAAALVLAATPADDPPSESRRARYRHANRDFGRVRLDIYPALPSDVAS